MKGCSGDIHCGVGCAQEDTRVHFVHVQAPVCRLFPKAYEIVKSFNDNPLVKFASPFDTRQPVF